MSEILKRIKDEIVYYVWYNPVHIYKEIKCWFLENAMNPWHWKMIWYAMFHHYGWDDCYMYKMLWYQIQKSRYYFKHRCFVLGPKELSDILKYQTLAIRMLDIILEHDDLFDFIEDETVDKSEPYYMRLKYVCKVKVNMKTRDRYKVKSCDSNGRIVYSSDYADLYPHELYKEKARKLLLCILDKYMAEWTD